MKNKPVLIMLFVFLLSFLVISSGMDRNITPIPIFIGSLDRTEVNGVVEKDISFYIKEYSLKEGIQSELTKIIILKALTTNTPINLAFALAENESNYNPKAVNKNSDGSYDFGLFQLNSGTFGDVKKNYSDVNKNTNTALTYLQELYSIYGSYDLALVAYNCGRVSRYNSKTQLHLKNILNKEEELDQWFNSKYRDTLSRGFN